MASSGIGHTNLGFVSDPPDGTSTDITASPVGEAFTNISLEESNVKDPENPPKKKKVPRRILHFSDGILEEYSTDEELDEEDNAPHVDPKKLPWLPWIWYYIATAASSTLYVADTCGEKLAWFFGITSPKYQYAIDEYNKMKAEDEAEKIVGRKRQEQELQPLDNTGQGLDAVPEIAILDKVQPERKY